MNEKIQIFPINMSPHTIDNRPVAVYVHGLASGAAGTTFNSLARKFKKYRWITTDFGECIEGNVAMLEDIIDHHHPLLIVGTSMGGVTTLYANAPSTIKIVCNPALSIADSVRQTIGLGQHEYFCERIDGKKSFELTEDMCLKYEEYIAKHMPTLGKENYAIFSAHDELLGDEASLVAQQVVSNAGYSVFIDQKGVHRITSSTIKLIGKIINEECK
jgi:predicted alpha/beta-fold hydrolase